MRNLTTAERNAVYKEAKDLLVSGIQVCLCDSIGYACNLLGFSVHSYPDITKAQFPEFYAHRPEDAGTFWWPKENKEIRVKVLDDCINKTEA